ncbi:uncharacterized protein LOC102708677 [Oryza brachyantha]|uniref:Uncharacterized protein n=1 Tax=Oryza brachyantha TaxID=4533 RepID=J3KUE8_ORYBR|nr:uncharacterized protein LOC102708677 [Oryza brachyantha]
MDDVWQWLISLPSLPGKPSSQTIVVLAASPDRTTSIALQADCIPSVEGDEGEKTLVDFSLALNGTNGGVRVLWTSGRFAAASSVALRCQLLARLLDEVIMLSPFIPCMSGNHGGLPEPKLDEEVVAGVFDMAETDGTAPAASFFSLALLLRLFWLCACEAPGDTGFLFFQALGADIERALGNCRPALGQLLCSVGPDVEQQFMRSLGYMFAKLCLLREMQAESAARQTALPAACLSLSYATEVHGLLILKGYAPVIAMYRVTSAAWTPIAALPHEAPEEPALRYGLAHQQLEVVAHLEYAICARNKRFMTISVRVDNVRVRVARLGLRKDETDTGGEDVDDDAMDSERHFPSRLRLWVGPRFGASYATGPSLGRSTGNPERHVEMTRTVRGTFAGTTKLANGVVLPRVKAKMRSSARRCNRSWRWEQEAEGSAGVFEGVLCDPVTGTEIASWRDSNGGTAGAADPRNGMRRRYGGPGRAFTKMWGLVVAGDDLPEEVTWRVGMEAEGRTVPWRVGLKAWVSYMPNGVRSRHFETRCIEWAHEVELPLVAVNGEDL